MGQALQRRKRKNVIQDFLMITHTKFCVNTQTFGEDTALNPLSILLLNLLSQYMRTYVSEIFN